MANAFPGTAEELSYIFDFIDFDESGQAKKKMEGLFFAPGE